MTAPNYPNDPENYPIGNPFSVGNKQFYWDGEKWRALSNADASLRSQLAEVDSNVLVGGETASKVAYIAKRTLLPSGGDDTAAFTALLAAYDEIWLAAGTYNVSELFIGDNKIVHTAGKATVLQQLAGLVGDLRIANITGSKVAFAPEGVTLKGNIATDTGEQRHGIIIRNNSGVQTDVIVGNVWGEDIRGDAVYVGGTFDNGGLPAINRVTIGDCYVKNCFRNGVSVTNNVDNLAVGDIYEDFALGCGYCAIDIEPDSAGKPTLNIRVGNVTGRRVGVVSQFPTSRLSGVTFGNLDLDETRGAPSPSITVGTGSDFYGRGVIVRNGDPVFNSVKLRNFRRNPVLVLKTGGDSASTITVIGLLDIDNCNTESSTFKDLLGFGGVNFANIGELKVTALDGANEFALTGNSALAETRVKIGKVSTDNCRFARFCGLDIGSGSMTLTNDLNMFQNISLPSTVKCVAVTSGRISAFNTAHLAFEACQLTWTGTNKFAGGNAGYHVSEIGCTTNGTWSAIRIDDVAVTIP